MENALALIEFNTVSSGIRALDRVVKSAEVELLAANPVCPGKYMIIFHGQLSSVKEATENAVKAEPEHVVDSMLLGNPSDSLLSALYGTTVESEGKSVGVIETYSGASAVLASDAAVKAANVSLAEIRLSRGMCGKSYALFNGSVADVEAAIETAKASVAENSALADFAVIANPDVKTREFLT